MNSMLEKAARWKHEHPHATAYLAQDDEAFDLVDAMRKDRESRLGISPLVPFSHVFHVWGMKLVTPSHPEGYTVGDYERERLVPQRS